MKNSFEKMARACGIALIFGTLTACSLLQTTPTPPPAPTSHAQEVQRSQTSTLTKIGSVTADVIGSPMDVERAIRHKADAAGAHYYQILLVSDTIRPGRWYSEAILFK